MAKRQKKTLISGVTREAMETAFYEYSIADAQIAKINATMDKQFTEIRNKHKDDLESYTAQREEAFEKLQVYAVENRESLFSRKKSMETIHGILGFRTGTPKLKTKKGHTWASVLELIKTFNPLYVRTEEAVAKDKLLADRENEAMPEFMDKVGIFVDQDETFYVEPKKEE